MRHFFASLLEVIEIALVAVGAVFFTRAFLVQPFLVSGYSMVPNFENGDYLLVDELTYHFRVPERGEVTVFHYPNDESTYFIKRIIGLPGERVEIQNGKVVVYNTAHPDGFTLDERYLPPGTVTTGSCGKTVFQLKADQYLVLGDNRPESFDSRCWGLLSDKEIVGLVRLRLWPLTSVKVFAAPQY